MTTTTCPDMPPPALTFRQKVGYASGNAGKSVVWSTFEYFFLFFLTELWGVPPAQAGIIILAALLWDAVTDPLLGYIADRSHSRWGKYTPYLIFGAPACGVSFTLLFFDPGWEGSAMAGYALGVGLLFRTCYTVCDVPHNALLARISEGSRDASLLSGLRFFFSSAGALAVSLAAVALFGNSANETRAERFLICAFAAGFVYVITIWTAAFSTRALDRQLPDESAGVSVKRTLRSLCENRQFLLLLAIAFCQVATIPMFSKGVAFFAKDVVGDERWTSQALICLTLAQAAAMPLWIAVSARHEKRAALIAAYALFLCGACGFAVAGSHQSWGFLTILLIGVGVGGMNMLIWAMLPDVINYGQQRTGQRVEAAAVSIFLLALKSGVGLSAMLTGLMLSAAGYSGGETPSPASRAGLLVLMCGIPATGAAICAATASFYRVPHDQDQNRSQGQLHYSGPITATNSPALISMLTSSSATVSRSRAR